MTIFISRQVDLLASLLRAAGKKDIIMKEFHKQAGLTAKEGKSQAFQRDVPAKEIWDERKIRKFIQRVGLKKTQTLLKQGMKDGSLGNIYVDLARFFNPKSPQQVRAENPKLFYLKEKFEKKYPDILSGKKAPSETWDEARGEMYFTGKLGHPSVWGQMQQGGQHHSLAYGMDPKYARLKGSDVTQQYNRIKEIEKLLRQSDHQSPGNLAIGRRFEEGSYVGGKLYQPKNFGKTPSAYVEMEKEVTQLWGKGSPFYHALSGGLVPNFARRGAKTPMRPVTAMPVPAREWIFSKLPWMKTGGVGLEMEYLSSYLMRNGKVGGDLGRLMKFGYNKGGRNEYGVKVENTMGGSSHPYSEKKDLDKILKAYNKQFTDSGIKPQELERIRRGAAGGMVPNFAPRGRVFAPGSFATQGYKGEGWQRLGAGVEGTAFSTPGGGGFKVPHQLNPNKKTNPITQTLAVERRRQQMRRPLIARRFNEMLGRGPMFAPSMRWGRAAKQEGVHFDIIKGKSLPELVRSGSITQAQQGNLLDYLAMTYKPKFAAYRDANPRMQFLPKLDRNPENFIIPSGMLKKVLPLIKSGNFAKLPERSVSAIDILESRGASQGIGGGFGRGPALADWGKKAKKAFQAAANAGEARSNVIVPAGAGLVPNFAPWKPPHGKKSIPQMVTPKSKFRNWMRYAMKPKKDGGLGLSERKAMQAWGQPSLFESGPGQLQNLLPSGINIGHPGAGRASSASWGLNTSFTGKTKPPSAQGLIPNFIKRPAPGAERVTNLGGKWEGFPHVNLRPGIKKGVWSDRMGQTVTIKSGMWKGAKGILSQTVGPEYYSILAQNGKFAGRTLSVSGADLGRASWKPKWGLLGAGGLIPNFARTSIGAAHKPLNFYSRDARPERQTMTDFFKKENTSKYLKTARARRPRSRKEKIKDWTIKEWEKASLAKKALLLSIPIVGDAAAVLLVRDVYKAVNAGKVGHHPLLDKMSPGAFRESMALQGMPFGGRASGLVPNFTKQGGLFGGLSKKAYSLLKARSGKEMTPGGHLPRGDELALMLEKRAEFWRHIDPKRSIRLFMEAKKVRAGVPDAGYGEKGLTGIGAHGIIPNFANALKTAIGRERAAGAPASTIRVSSSSRLKSGKNPLGLAVINTRDEPAGVNQGINRAMTMGIDPKTHGASRGLYPNFAASVPGGFVPGRQPAPTYTPPPAPSAPSTPSTTPPTGGMPGGGDPLMKMFAFTTALSMLSGVIGEITADMGSSAKKMGEIATGLTTAAMTFVGFFYAAQAFKQSGMAAQAASVAAGGSASAGRGSRVLGRAFGVIGIIVAVGAALHTLLKAFAPDFMDRFKSSVTLATEKIDEFKKTTDAIKGVLEGTERVKEIGKGISKLQGEDVLSFDEVQKLTDLQLEEIQGKAQGITDMAQLLQNDEIAKDFQTLINQGKSQTEALQELVKITSRAGMVTNVTKSIQEVMNRVQEQTMGDTDFSDLDKEMKDVIREMTEGYGKTLGNVFGGLDEEGKGAIKEIGKLMQEFGHVSAPGGVTIDIIKRRLREEKAWIAENKTESVGERISTAAQNVGILGVGKTTALQSHMYQAAMLANYLKTYEQGRGGFLRTDKDFRGIARGDYSGDTENNWAVNDLQDFAQGGGTTQRTLNPGPMRNNQRNIKRRRRPAPWAGAETGPYPTYSDVMEGLQATPRSEHAGIRRPVWSLRPEELFVPEMGGWEDLFADDEGESGFATNISKKILKLPGLSMEEKTSFADFVQANEENSEIVRAMGEMLQQGLEEADTANDTKREVAEAEKRGLAIFGKTVEAQKTRHFLIDQEIRLAQDRIKFERRWNNTRQKIFEKMGLLDDNVVVMQNYNDIMEDLNKQEVQARKAHLEKIDSAYDDFISNVLGAGKLGGLPDELANAIKDIDARMPGGFRVPTREVNQMMLNQFTGEQNRQTAMTDWSAAREVVLPRGYKLEIPGDTLGHLSPSYSESRAPGHGATPGQRPGPVKYDKATGKSYIEIGKSTGVDDPRHEQERVYREKMGKQFTEEITKMRVREQTKGTKKEDAIKKEADMKKEQSAWLEKQIDVNIWGEKVADALIRVDKEVGTWDNPDRRSLFGGPFLNQDRRGPGGPGEAGYKHPMADNIVLTDPDRPPFIIPYSTYAEHGGPRPDELQSGDRLRSLSWYGGRLEGRGEMPAGIKPGGELSVLAANMDMLLALTNSSFVSFNDSLGKYYQDVPEILTSIQDNLRKQLTPGTGGVVSLQAGLRGADDPLVRSGQFKVGSEPVMGDPDYFKLGPKGDPTVTTEVPQQEMDLSRKRLSFNDLRMAILEELVKIEGRDARIAALHALKKQRMMTITDSQIITLEENLNRMYAEGEMIKSRFFQQKKLAFSDRMLASLAKRNAEAAEIKAQAIESMGGVAKAQLIMENNLLTKSKDELANLKHDMALQTATTDAMLQLKTSKEAIVGQVHQQLDLERREVFKGLLREKATTAWLKATEDGKQIALMRLNTDKASAERSADDARRQLEFLQMEKELLVATRTQVKQSKDQAKIAARISSSMLIDAESREMILGEGRAANLDARSGTLSEVRQRTDALGTNIGLDAVIGQTDTRTGLAEGVQNKLGQHVVDVASGSKNAATSLKELIVAEKELNREYGVGSQAVDAFRVKVAESLERVENFGEHLAALSYEGLRSGLVQLIKDFGDASKTSSEAWNAFGAGLAAKISDALIQVNVDKILGGIGSLFGVNLFDTATRQLTALNAIKEINTRLLGEGSPIVSAIKDLRTSLTSLKTEDGLLFNAGGQVQGFAQGGLVTGPPGKDNIPAMLTAGEYVLPKKMFLGGMMKGLGKFFGAADEATMLKFKRGAGGGFGLGVSVPPLPWLSSLFSGLGSALTKVESVMNPKVWATHMKYGTNPLGGTRELEYRGRTQGVLLNGQKVDPKDYKTLGIMSYKEIFGQNRSHRFGSIEGNVGRGIPIGEHEDPLGIPESLRRKGFREEDAGKITFRKRRGGKVGVPLNRGGLLDRSMVNKTLNIDTAGRFDGEADFIKDNIINVQDREYGGFQEGGKVIAARFKNGGGVDKPPTYWESVQSRLDDNATSAYNRAAQGFGSLGGTALATWAYRKTVGQKYKTEDPSDEAKFNETRLKYLNTLSSVEADQSQLSGRAIASSAVRQDYDKYLLEKKEKEITEINKDYVEGVTAANQWKIAGWSIVAGAAFDALVGGLADFLKSKKDNAAYEDFKAQGGKSQGGIDDLTKEGGGHPSFQNPKLIAGGGDGGPTRASYEAAMRGDTSINPGIPTIDNPVTGTKTHAGTIKGSFSTKTEINRVREVMADKAGVSVNSVYVNPVDFRAAKAASTHGKGLNVDAIILKNPMSSFDSSQSSRLGGLTQNQIISNYGFADMSGAGANDGSITDSIWIQIKNKGGLVKGFQSGGAVGKTPHLEKVGKRDASSLPDSYPSLRKTMEELSVSFLAQGFEKGGNVPAMLTDGEFIFSQKAASQLGEKTLNDLNGFERGGHVKGPGGIDRVGPLMLQNGEFVVNAGSTNALESEKPGLLSLLNEKPGRAREFLQGYQEGGRVGDAMRGASSAGLGLTALNHPDRAPVDSSQVIAGDMGVTNNINISINVDKGGAVSTETAAEGQDEYAQQRQLSSKIKNAVIDVIRDEKRLGGELYGGSVGRGF